MEAADVSAGEWLASVLNGTMDRRGREYRRRYFLTLD